MKKKQIVTIASVVVLIIVIFLVIKGIQNKKANPADSNAEAVAEVATSVYKETVHGGSVSIDIPVFEAKEENIKLGASLANAIDVLQRNTPEASVTGGFDTRSAGSAVNYIFTLEASTGVSEVVTFVRGEKDAVNVEAYLSSPAKLGKIASYMKGQLQSRFPQAEAGVIQGITEPIVSNFSNYRIADNGVVFMFSQEKLDGRTSPLYHEVLVPTDVISAM